MKPKARSQNARLTTSREREKQHIIKSVVRRRRQRLSLRNLGRTTWLVLKAVILIAFAGGIYWGATEGYRQLFWENPDYSLIEVKLQTNGSLTLDEATAATGIIKGRNIFSYELDVAREKLRALPQIVSVEIRRYLPGRIEISVTERKPVAWISAQTPADFQSATRSHMLDASGVVFAPRRVLPEYRALPVLCGFDAGEVKPGRTLRSAELETALELLGRLRDTADFRVQIMDLSKGWCLVVTDQRQTRITFGLDHLDDQLWRLAEVQKEAARYGQDLKTVNVMVSRNVPVTFVPPSTPEPDLDAALLGEDAEPRRSKPAQEIPKAVPVKKPAAQPARKAEPSKGGGEKLLNPFRRA